MGLGERDEGLPERGFEGGYLLYVVEDEVGHLSLHAFEQHMDHSLLQLRLALQLSQQIPIRDLQKQFKVNQRDPIPLLTPRPPALPPHPLQLLLHIHLLILNLVVLDCAADAVAQPLEIIEMGGPGPRGQVLGLVAGEGRGQDAATVEHFYLFIIFGGFGFFWGLGGELGGELGVGDGRLEGFGGWF